MEIVAVSSYCICKESICKKTTLNRSTKRRGSSYCEMKMDIDFYLILIIGGELVTRDVYQGVYFPFKRGKKGGIWNLDV